MSASSRIDRRSSDGLYLRKPGTPRPSIRSQTTAATGRNGEDGPADCRTWRQSFQTAKNEVGLDNHLVRRPDAWYAHITLFMLAAAFLAVTRARQLGGSVSLV